MEKNFKIILKRDSSYFQKKLAIELSAILGFESVSIVFPIVEVEDAASEISGRIQYIIRPAEQNENKIKFQNGQFIIYVSECQESVDQICRELLERSSEYINGRKSEHEIQIDNFKAASDYPYPVEASDKREKKGLESLFEIGNILKDNDGDLMPDEVCLKFLVDESITLSQTLAACNIAARIGIETLGLTYPITVNKDDGNSNLLKFRHDGNASISINDAGRKIITLFGDGKALERFSTEFCESFPKISAGKYWLDYIKELIEGFKMKTLDGQLSMLESKRSDLNKDTICFFSPNVEGKQELEQYYPGVKFNNYKGLKKVFEEDYDIPWEVDVCKQLLEQKVFKKVKAGDDVEIQIALSEDKDSRRKLSEYILHELQHKQVKIEKLDILCAYKQGFSWIDEKIIPDIINTGKKPGLIEIAFRPFLSEGETEGNNKNGAMPVLSTNMNNLGKGLDLPIRFLQELYPIDDVIAEKLIVDRNIVKFKLYEGYEDVTYVVHVISEDGEDILTDCYKTVCSERNYINEYPETGLVHPGTGYLKVKINGIAAADEIIKTDMENIWEVYQTCILPYCKNYIDRISDGNPVNSMQPFFSQMRLDIEVSEPDYHLNCRQDMISSINSLHEDLYFIGLEFFSIYGIKATGNKLDAPGLILPVIRKTIGKPKFKFTLFDQNEKQAMFFINGQPVGLEAKDIKAEAILQDIKMYKQGFEAVIAIESENNLSEYLRAYAKLLEKGILETSSSFDGVTRVTFELNGEYIKSVDLDKNEHSQNNDYGQKPIDINDIDIMEDRLIGYDEYLTIINQLKRVKGIEVYQVAESYQGRKIYAIEILPDYTGYVSKTKLINQNPVEYINARHHANEVSSTNACFMLLKELLTNKKYNGIGNKLNLVLIPFENPDAAAIHYELQKDNPNWALHTARFNSLGQEIAAEYLKEDTIHTEAYAFTKTWRKWLPDVITDNHGVPSHEWDQQFAGYTSPWYKGFWLPRALLYSYFMIIADEDYASNVSLNEKIEDAVAESLLTDDSIRVWNRDWKERFEKYAHQWLPKVYPANYYKEMISYKIKYQYRMHPLYTAICYPWITTVNFMSEVADETAQGDYLKLCATTHKVHDLAVIDLLVESRCVYKKSVIENEGIINKYNIRKRPLI